MERARRFANRAFLKRLVSEAKQYRKNETLLNASSPLSFTPSRYVSSLSPCSFLRSNGGSRSDLLGGRNVSYNVGAQTRSISVEALKPSDTFARRHNSPTPEEQSKMAASCGFESLDSLIDATVPKSIRIDSMKFSKFDEGLTESQMIEHMQKLASKNKVFKSFIGMGYYNTYVPPVILRNIMENPAWYTQYTPYQAEIAQGRLESLMNFQTVITDLTGLPMSNASLLDEGTAAAEAMAMCNNILKGKKKTFVIASNCHPQTIDICKTRADGFDLKVVTADLKDIDYKSGDVCGVLVQYPGTEGEVLDYAEFIKNAHANGVKVVMTSDLLALTVLKPPGELGADIVVGSAQRFGVPMGYGGPHAAFLATSQEYKRLMLGRIIGVSVDASRKPALRMAMQTREQHIRRDNATSKICTAQANKMLKPDRWQTTFDSDGKILGFQKALKRIILGGVDPSIRPEVWEFLLGCYALGSTAEYRKQLRTARREHYENLIKHCQMMHSSIGTGSLAYVVGSKVMDMRAPSKDDGRIDSKIETREASVDNTNKVESIHYRNNDTDTSYACQSESSSDSGDLVSVRGSVESAAYDSSLFIAAASGSNNYGTLNLETEADGAQSVTESSFDFPPLPVTDLFRKSEEDQNEDMEEEKISCRKLRFKDDKMHSFQINNNVELVVESNGLPSNNVSHPINSEIELVSADVHEPVLQSDNIDKKKTEVVNRMRISDVPDADFMDMTLPQGEAVSKDRMSEWLWTLHRIVVDVVRTDSHLEFYEDTRNLARMSDILAVYAWVDPSTGYCQGMSDLLSPFVVLFEDDADAFWCFEMLIRRMRENFQMEGPTGVMKQLQALWHILELTDREMFAHLSHIGADSLHFAFRMLMVLFRRELPFNEALRMWEMMWAADFDESLASDLEENCLATLVVPLPRDFEGEIHEESIANGSSITKEGSQSSHGNADCSVSDKNGMKSASTHHFCGFTRNIWSRHDPVQISGAVSSTRKGDDELSVFCVAAILIINRQKIIRETRSIDDMIKIFNDKILKINVKRCIRTAIKLRKKYFYKLIKRKKPPSQNGD